MHIGKQKLDGNLILAPMSDVTNLPFRLLCKKYGASLVYSEMASSEAIVRENQKTMARGFTCMEEKPLGIQLLGSNADSLARSAHIITQRYLPEIIDVNLGCPAQNIIKNECGASLLEKPKVIGEIIQRLSESLDVPLTAKTGINKTKDIVSLLEVMHGLRANNINHIL